MVKKEISPTNNVLTAEMAWFCWYHGVKTSYSRKILHSWKNIGFACLKTSNALERASQLALVVKNSLPKCRRHKRQGFNPWVGRCPGVGTGNPLQYSCLDNSMKRRACGLQSMGSHRVRHDSTHLHSSNALEMSRVWSQQCKLFAIGP